MNPPIFALIKANGPCTALLGTNPVRFYPCGRAPKDPPKPYGVYSVYNALPENQLSGTPQIDNKGTQVDLYAEKEDGLKALFLAVRDALEPHAHMTSYSTPSPDNETALFSARLEFDFWDAR